MLLIRQVNYNQVVVIYQILQECFLQNFNMQKFQNMYHSNSMTFQGLSRAWNFFSKIQGLSRTSQGPYEPWVINGNLWDTSVITHQPWRGMLHVWKRDIVSLHYTKWKSVSIMIVPVVTHNSRCRNLAHHKIWHSSKLSQRKMAE